MHALEQVFAEIIATGLKRKSIKTCSKWAQAYRVAGGETPGPWDFKFWPWSRAMHDAEEPFCVGMKSAQMSYTETMLNRTFFKMDIEGVNCLYALPNKNPDASDFSTSRFDPALELSEHLRRMFSDVKNVGHKRAGAANLWIRGSQSRAGFKSIDPSFVVLDEVDEMNEDNIQLAYRRTDGQAVAQIWAISTPTIPEKRIHGMFLSTNQEYWYFQCPNCWKEITLEFPECLVVVGETLLDPRIKESHVICPLCKKKIEHEDKIKSQVETGRWIPRVPEVEDRRGFYINQLSSCKKTPDRIAVTAIEAQIKPAAEQEYWNSIGGLPHVVAGARVENHHISACTTDRRMSDRPPPKTQFITMGVDVGKWFHFEIDAWHLPRLGPDLNMIAECVLIKAGKVEKLHEIKNLLREWQVQFVVLDWQPETRLIYEFCCEHWGHAKRCRYARGIGSKKLVISPTEDEHMVDVNRTFWLDTSLGRVISRRIEFPKDLPEEYKLQLKNLVKHYREDSSGDDMSEYLKTGPDHSAHARSYSEIALPIAASIATNTNIRSFL